MWLKGFFSVIFSMSLLIPASSQRGSIFQAMAGLWRDIVELNDGEPPDTPVLNKEYDFIIIGAGTAGCILTNRLTEVKDFNVLLIEAGGNEQVFMDIPVLATMLQFTDANWNYHTEPQMGPADDAEAVVDPRLRIHGIQGLRIVDASIMPHVPAAHTNAPTMMLAEKAADMIKEDWGVAVTYR